MAIRPEHTQARRHLARKDPVLSNVIAHVGSCTLQCESNYFAALARSIVSQQISIKAAQSILNRLESLLGKGGLKPPAVLAQTPDQLRSVGLSSAKSRYLLDLAEKVQSGAVPLRGLEKMTDEEVIEAILPVKGIGRWTAQMFLIFSLNRMDVLPVDDLGLRLGVQQQYGLPELPDRETLTQLAEPWRPYRSIGTWYIWRSRGSVPQS